MAIYLAEQEFTKVRQVRFRSEFDKLDEVEKVRNLANLQTCQTKV